MQNDFNVTKAGIREILFLLTLIRPILHFGGLIVVETQGALHPQCHEVMRGA